ncbi:MAG: diaminopimelate epimerase [Planctomycetes bacterium]|nr:diaminopimelate epimerase [Planctomycetota bacterium]
MKFVKMHGTGNDYVFVSLFEEIVTNPSTLAKMVSDRHVGIGADGLILIGPSKVAAVRMEIYNADGSRAQMCGNGIRCVAKYAYERGLAGLQIASETGGPPSRNAGAGGTKPLPPLCIETDVGIKEAHCTVTDGKVSSVRIDMGTPSLTPRDIPVRHDGDRAIDLPIEINGRTLRMTCVSMGNPHAVVFVENLSVISLAQDGAAIESHPLFPERVNAHFACVETPGRITVSTWERGSGATLACGTGASAVCVAGVLAGRTSPQVTVVVPGGELELNWDRAGNNHVYMTGPAVEVFSGDWPS